MDLITVSSQGESVALLQSSHFSIEAFKVKVRLVSDIDLGCVKLNVGRHF